MRPLAAIAVLVGFATSAVGDEKKYESKEGAYAVAFPGKPATQSTKANDTEVYFAMVKQGQATYLVTYSDLAAEIVKKEKPKDLLAKGETGLVRQFKATITDAKDSEFGKAKYPARELTAQKDATHVRVLIVLADARVYQVMVIGSKDDVTGKDADAFFKSFEITK